MALSIKHNALLTSFFGIVSFICGVIAENKKPAAGTTIAGKDVVICKYPSDPTVVLGYLSFATLVITTFLGFKSIFHPYNKRHIPYVAVFRSTSMRIFFSIAWLTAGLAAALLLEPTITEQFHLGRTIHHNLKYDCPTAKTGLLGGGAFVALDSTLFWLICIMLVSNAREDYFDDVDNPGKNVDDNSLTFEALKHASLA